MKKMKHASQRDAVMKEPLRQVHECVFGLRRQLWVVPPASCNRDRPGDHWIRRVGGPDVTSSSFPWLHGEPPFPAASNSYKSHQDAATI